jgi:hypothetical protein
MGRSGEGHRDESAYDIVSRSAPDTPGPSGLLTRSNRPRVGPLAVNNPCGSASAPPLPRWTGTDTPPTGIQPAPGTSRLPHRIGQRRVFAPGITRMTSKANLRLSRRDAARRARTPCLHDVNARCVRDAVPRVCRLTEPERCSAGVADLQGIQFARLTGNCCADPRRDCSQDRCEADGFARRPVRTPRYYRIALRGEVGRDQRGPWVAHAICSALYTRSGL